MKACQAVGCPVVVKFGFCGSHSRLVPVVIRRRLKARDPQARLDAIRAVAAKEGKLKLFNELLMAQDR